MMAEVHCEVEIWVKMVRGAPVGETRERLRKLMVQDQDSTEEEEDSEDDGQHWRGVTVQQHDHLFE